ncbi:MAG: universal stress protein [Desulfobacterales bacterium]|jgi:nucleotide-binding universal stress UspA family protein|nr:universal stress protein [Desulfobacterales bacterium]
MFKKILLATTASPNCDNAAKVAFDMQLKWDAKLIVLHVFGVHRSNYTPFGKKSKTLKKKVMDEEYAALVIEEMKSIYADELKHTQGIVLKAKIGRPDKEILRMAHEEDVDLIIMGAHAREEGVGPLRLRSVVGNTMQRVAKSAPCPVIIISRPLTIKLKLFSNIVFGTDFSKASDSAFPFTCKLAKEAGAKLHFFHALNIYYGEAGQVLQQAEIEKMIKDARKKIEKRYISQLGGFDNYEIEVWEGIPYVEIVKFAREKNCDLIVLAHHTKIIESSLASFGSTTEQVVLRATQPVASINCPDRVA